MTSGILFFEFDWPATFEDPERGCTVVWGGPRTLIYMFHDRLFSQPLHSPLFDPDHPYDFPLSTIHPGEGPLPYPATPLGQDSPMYEQPPPNV